MFTNLSDGQGDVTQAHIGHYEKRPGPGLVIVENAAVLPEGRLNTRQLGIYADRHIKGLSALAKIIHANGSAAGIQIHHAGMLSLSKEMEDPRRRRITIAGRFFRQQFAGPGLMKIREAFQAAARRALEAGFDIVEIHGAHGYLFSQFLSPLKNWRIAGYGGKIENRSRLLLEVFKDVSSVTSDRALATCRLGLADGHWGGLTLADGISTAALLQRNGARLLSISCGGRTPCHVGPSGSPFSAILHLAEAAKRKLSIPVIGGGGIRDPGHAERALQGKMADLIFVGRGLLADPAWAAKAVGGQPHKIIACRNCKTCFHLFDPSLCPAGRRS